MPRYPRRFGLLPVEIFDRWPLDLGLSLESTTLLDRLATGRPKSFNFIDAVGQWIDEDPISGENIQFAIEAVGWAEALPRLAGRLCGSSWCAVVGFLAELVEEAKRFDPDNNPLIYSVLAIELPLVLAYQFPEWSQSQSVRKEAIGHLAQSFELLTDGEGQLHADHLPIVRPLLACWSRCLALGEDLLTNEAAGQFEWFVRQALRWTRPDGSQVFDKDSAITKIDSLFQLALALDDDDDDQDLATLVLPGSKKSEVERLSEYAMPESAIESEWAGVSVLRGDWPWEYPSLWMTYPEETVKAELIAGRSVLFSGQWALDVRFDGKKLKPVTEWETVAFSSDDDMDYLELRNRARTGNHRPTSRNDVARRAIHVNR